MVAGGRRASIAGSRLHAGAIRTSTVHYTAPAALTRYGRVGRMWETTQEVPMTKRACDVFFDYT